MRRRLWGDVLGPELSRARHHRAGITWCSVAPALNAAARLWYSLHRRSAPRRREVADLSHERRRLGEANIPTEPPAPEQDARLPRSDAHPRRPERIATETPSGSTPAGCRLGVSLAGTGGCRAYDPAWAVRGGRLTTRADFARVYREGRRLSGDTLVLYVRSNDAPLRVGVTAGRKLGGAVRRNRAKRRLREAFGRLQSRLSGRGEVVLAARSRVLDATFSEILADMEALCAAGQLLRGCER